MEFDEGVALDTSQVQDARGGGVGGRVALGGGGLGLVGILIYFLLNQFGGLPAGTPLSTDDAAAGRPVSSGDLEAECRTGRDANTKPDCARVAIINSIQAYWADEFARSGLTYREADTTFFRGAVNTGCGSASADVGPFYCPADQGVYVDLSFFDDLKTRFGARGGTFAEAYVLAHEYGHHVQNLLGTSRQVGRETGPTSGSVRLELQADCYAGVWANHATTTPSAGGQPLIKNITQDDVDRAVDVAERIGDDFIQENLGGGRVDESQFSHGTSAQREKWFLNGINNGQPTQCDTFGARNLG
ncbi:KPN_02809 family neutral zinc metallopeptidase [Actinokineospora sp. NPDC004072]